MKEVGFKNIMVNINSIGDKECRPAYKKELVNYYRKKFNYLCKDCKRKLKDNPLRLLDCKEPGCVELKAQAPQMIEHLCDACKTHFKSVLEFLDEGQIPYLLDNYLVRGFDYYGRTVFEIFLEEENKKKDIIRQNILEKLGFKIIRYKNEQIKYELKNVLQDIYNQIHKN